MASAASLQLPESPLSDLGGAPEPTTLTFEALAVTVAKGASGGGFNPTGVMEGLKGRSMIFTGGVVSAGVYSKASTTG